MLKCGIAAEAPGDVRVVSRLADRIIVDEVDWVTEEVLDAYRTWLGVAGEGWVDVHGALERAKESGLPVYGHFGDDAGLEDAQMVRAILMLFADEPEVSMVVVARDQDGHPSRTAGFEQARADGDWPFEVVLAAPQPAQEAWLLVGLVPSGEAERAAHVDMRRELGFDATVSPGRLKHGREQGKKNCKRVLKKLCPDGEAEDRFHTRSLHALTLHGADSGLTRFIETFRPLVRRSFGATP